jgi:protease-4
MKKRPFLLAMALLGGIFAFFLLLVLAVASFMGPSSTRFALNDKVAVIEVFGVIADSKQIIGQLHNFWENDSIKAIVLRVDSPGGGVGPSQEIHDEIKRIAVDKPLVVSMGSVAASGGYYIAAPAQRIIANPGTITGSIGVIMEFTNLQELFEKIGLKSQVVKSGLHKDIGSPVRPMTDGDRAILQAMIDDVHSQFVEAVAAGRNMEIEAVRELADGRIFTGRQAMSLGLVDELGNLEVAIKVAAQLAGIEGDPDVVYPPEDKPRFMDLFIEQSLNSLQQALQKKQVTGLQYMWSVE